MRNLEKGGKVSVATTGSSALAAHPYHLEKNLLTPSVKSFDTEVVSPGVMLMLFYVKIPQAAA